MNSEESAFKLFCGPGRNEINRRTFFSQSVGCAAGLALLTSPGIITEVLAAQEDQSKEDIIKVLDEKVAQYLQKYRSCALASFEALNEQFKLNADDRTLRALFPFTGGIAMRGETCGAVTGSMLALGFYFEAMNQEAKAATGASLKHGGMFFEKFTKEFSSTRCKEVLKHQFGRSYDFLNPEELKLYMEATAKDNKCMGVVKKAVFIAADIILANS